MGRFLIFPCFPSSKHPKLNKATSSSSFQTLVSKLRANGEDKGSGKLGVLVKLENEKEREDEKNKEKGKLGVLVEIETENERKEADQDNSSVHMETENKSRSILNHRYHNCLTDEDEDHVLVQEDSPESVFSLSIDPTRQSKSSPDKKIDSLLNPIENLERKTTKSISPISGLNHLQEKENLSLSLASWLVDPEKSTTPGKEESQTSWKTIEDRPILGAWSIDEVKQISARSTPRKSPRHHPDETPIIGTVGSYWSHTGQVIDSSKFTRNKKNNGLSCHASSKRRLERAFDNNDG